MTRHLTTETKRAILAALAAGEKQAEVAAKFGVHWTYPGILRRRGFREEVVVLTDEQRVQIAHDFRAGVPRKVIAYKYGVTPPTVARIAGRMGFGKVLKANQLEAAGA